MRRTCYQCKRTIRTNAQTDNPPRVRQPRFLYATPQGDHWLCGQKCEDAYNGEEEGA